MLIKSVIALVMGTMFLVNLSSLSQQIFSGQIERPVTFYVALRPNQDGVARLEKEVLSRSYPDSPNYGNWMTVGEINQMIATSEADQNRVETWFRESGVYQFENSSVSWYADAVRVTTSHVVVEKMFNISMDTVIFNREIGTISLFTHENYQIPSHLTDVIEFVDGLSYPNWENRSPRPISYPRHVSDSVDGGMVTREVMQNLYQIPSNQASESGVSVGPIEFQGTNGFNNTDLVYSQKANGLSANPVQQKNIIGKVYLPDTESTLDIQMIGQLADGAELWYENHNGWMYVWSVDFFNRQRIPYVISLSWGWNEMDQCSFASCNNSSSRNYTRRCNYEFMKIAARGVTMLVASGDAGSPGRTEETCVPGMGDPPNDTMNPVFPGSSKWVTSVGATYLAKDGFSRFTPHQTPVCQKVKCSNSTIEQGVTYEQVGWTSGAGFDRWEETPAWQVEEVMGYINSGVQLPNQTYWNQYGRAYPDVSAVGHNCLCRMGGDSWYPVDGTSCSAPVFAGVISILNNHQASKGKSRLGFANPLLYQMYRDHPPTFHDITVGNSSCTETECCNSDFGFRATTGWDPVGGLGTPNVMEMMNYLDSHT